MMKESDLEKARIRNRRHRAKNIDLLNAKSRAWYAANKEKAKLTRKLWREKNADKDKTDVRQYWNVHRERLYWLAKQRIDENRGAYNAKAAKHRSQKLKATPAWASKEKVLEMYEAAQAATEIFGISVHVDHMVPLRSKYVYGLHCEANLRLLPGLDNQHKSNRVWPDMPDSLAA